MPQRREQKRDERYFCSSKREKLKAGDIYVLYGEMSLFFAVIFVFILFVMLEYLTSYNRANGSAHNKPGDHTF
jgi:hypothetical protein